MLWDYLGRKYVPDFQGMFGDEDSQRVWELAKDARLQRHERDVLVSTFDQVMIRRHHFLLLASSMDLIGLEMTRHSGGFGEPKVTEKDSGHYPEHAAALRNMMLDQGAYAACWDQTSVADDGWNRCDKCPTCSQDVEDGYRKYDLSRDSGHWFMLEDAED